MTTKKESHTESSTTMSEPTKVEERSVADQAQEMHKQIEDILKEYNYQESNVPINHQYWNLLRQYRSLKNA